MQQQDSTSGASVPLVGGSDHADAFLPADTINGQPDYAPLILTGTIEDVQQRVTTQGRAWASGTLVLDSGERVPFLVFPSTYAPYGHLLAEGGPVTAYVRVDRRGDDARACVRALHRDQPSVEALLAALTGVPRPAQARDGDCLIYEPQVRAALTAAGIDAREATVTGWADPARTTIAFMHKATVCAGRIVDVTAGQFSPVLPAVMFEPTDRYSLQLANAAGVAAVTVHHTEGTR